MFFEKIVSKGLAHFSYLVGDKGKAFVIDPRRDVQEYLDLAVKHQVEITHIFETHRNEDYIIGSLELAEKTGAKIYISGHEDLDYSYGEKIFDGDIYEIGDLKLKALHTPGHTLGHLSYVLYENKREEPYLVFTGDCLFMGDLGRTDFYGEENLNKMTGLLYDSIFEKLIPLGEDTLVFPAHGAGSACGETMEDRPFTTIGYEKTFNKALQVESKEEFIKNFGRMRIKPRYFEAMEVYNVKGAPFVGSDFYLKTLKLDNLKENYVLLDIRSKEAYIGGHIPGSYFISEKNLSTFLGTFFETNTPIVLISEKTSLDYLAEISKEMKRKGFDNIVGILENGVNAYIKNGLDLEKGKTIKLCDLKNLEGDFTILDVRVDSYIKDNNLREKSINIPLQELYKDYNKLDLNKDTYILCSSGDRSASAYSYLINKEFKPIIIEGGID